VPPLKTYHLRTGGNAGVDGKLRCLSIFAINPRHHRAIYSWLPKCSVSARQLTHEVVVALERFRLDGRVVVVTGASKGVGFNIAQVLAEAGATVVCCARNASLMESAVRKIKETGYLADAIAAEETVEADHGRLEMRTYWITSRNDMHDHCCMSHGPHPRTPNSIRARMASCSECERCMSLNTMAGCGEARAAHNVMCVSGSYIAQRIG